MVSDSKDALYKEGNDFESTILVGNLPFTCTENELINHFKDVAKMSRSGNASSADSGILNVKIVRDRETQVGKGIAFIQFVNKFIMRMAIEQKNGSEFKGRGIRIKKAVNPKKIEENILNRTKGVSEVKEAKKAAKEAKRDEKL